LPSGGLFNAIDTVAVQNIPLRLYLDLLSLKNISSDAIYKTLMKHYLVDESLMGKLPAVDAEYLATIMYSENFNHSVNLSITCPYCENKIVEDFMIPEYECGFLDESDGSKFTTVINGKAIKLTLPVAPKRTYDVTDYVINKDVLEGMSEDDLNEIIYYVKLEIESCVGINKSHQILCNNCDSVFLMSKPCGKDLFMYSSDNMLAERQSILTIINMFAYAGHQPLSGLIDMKYKDVMDLWNNFSELKENENQLLSGKTGSL
jgi:hypothetical protein